MIYFKKMQVPHHQPCFPLGFDLCHNCNNDADVICMAIAYKYRSISTLDQILSSCYLSDTHYTQAHTFCFCFKKNSGCLYVTALVTCFLPISNFLSTWLLTSQSCWTAANSIDQFLPLLHSGLACPTCFYETKCSTPPCSSSLLNTDN